MSTWLCYLMNWMHAMRKAPNAMEPPWYRVVFLSAVSTGKVGMRALSPPAQ